MTFDKLKYELKRTNKNNIGTITFYTVPDKLSDYNVTDENIMALPYKREVKVSVNKHGKRILDFVGGISDTNTTSYFFEDEIEIADALATRLQLKEYNKILAKKSKFEKESNIIIKVNKYLEKYPELFV